MRVTCSRTVIVVGTLVLLATESPAVIATSPGGESWILAAPTASPYARHGHAMVYDSARARVVLFGGLLANQGHPLLADTWEWDGINWVERATATSPPARMDHAMAYDSARGRVVLLGGNLGGVGSTDTWEWDGDNWSRRTTAVSPPLRTGHAMAYDSARGRVVLFGGTWTAKLGDTWEWDGMNWVQRTPATSPPPRSSHAMVYDSARGRVVLFGGIGGDFLNDTWEWDGTNWIQRMPATSPPASAHRGMAYDSARNRALLFVQDETWEWNGYDWTERTPAHHPSARIAQGMTYDSSRGRVVLFSGVDGFGGYGYQDTWEWDGNDWVDRTPAAGPPSRLTHALVYDSARARTVLFGGGGFPLELLADTWEWDGAWTRRTPANSPSWRSSHAMAYDGARGRTVLFGGYQDYPSPSHYAQDTWEWDGDDWIERTPATSPPARFSHAMAYDSARRRVVLFGGWNGARLADTWEWDGNEWIERTTAVSPSARSNPAMAYDSARARVVLFGGSGLDDTWEWDGQSWIARTPSTRPAPGDFAMAYDSARGRVVLFGVYWSSETVVHMWEWDGTNWVERSLAATPTARQYSAISYDSARNRMVLFGGGAGPDGWLYLGDTWEYGSIETCAHASSVAAFTPGAGTSDTSAVAALGQADGVAVSLGLEGSVVLQLDEAVPNGPGTDLVVHEIGAFGGGVDESYLVETSENGVAYAFNGVCAGGDCLIDLAGAGLASARYVRITDRASPGEPPPAAGADIDGLSVVACDACDLTSDGADFDGDGVANACDDCPEHANPAQIDTDGDGAGDACDCAPADPLARPAEEVAGLAVEKLGVGSLRLSWSPAPGASTYAVIRGELSVLSATELGGCVVGGIAARAWDDPELPPPAGGFTYLVRGESPVCGPGTLGFGAFGLPRIDTGSACSD